MMDKLELIEAKIENHLCGVGRALCTQKLSIVAQPSKGFTLIEMIIVIVITGVIAGMVAMFIKAPVQGYMDSARRAELTDIADTAVLRIARDVRTAVPNSLRTPNPVGASYIEFLPTRDGGRYRVNPTGGAGGCAAVVGNSFGDALDYAATDTCFEIIGATHTFAAGDQIVIGSTQSNGNPPYQATNSATGIRRAYNGATGSAVGKVVITAPVAFPAFAEQQGYRFEVVPGDQQAVTYACLNIVGTGIDANGEGTGTLTRIWKYGFNAAQVAPNALGGSSALLADKVSACNFVYDTSNVRNSLLAVSLTITRGGESVRLYHEIHVNNVP